VDRRPRSRVSAAAVAGSRDRGVSWAGKVGSSIRLAQWARWNRRSGSGGGGEGRDPGQRLDEAVLPGPAGGQVRREAAGRAGRPAEELKQPAAHRPCRAWGRVFRPELAGPALEVVSEAGDHRPGGVGGEAARREVGGRMVFRSRDRELAVGVLAVLAVGGVRVVFALVTKAKWRQ
jgi:hypothetical protein